MHPVLFSTRVFGLLDEPWSLHVYGLLIAAGFLLAMQLVAISLLEFTESLRWNLDRLEMVYQMLYFFLAAVIL